MRIVLLSALLFALALSRDTVASELAKVPSAPPARIVAINVLPSQVVIDRPGATQRLVVLGRRADGSTKDVTAQARFTASTPAAAPVSAGGVVSALRNGAGRIAITLSGSSLRAAVPVTVRNAGGAYQWDFTRQIAPVLVRGGCSGASCHGATAGRGGFKLSFFGHDPEADYDSLVHGAGGRRVNRTNPGASLVLLKPTMGIPHGGGKRFAAGSPEYRLLARWLASGAPRGVDTARVERLEILPRERLLTRPGDAQRLLVTAYFSDGTREDVSDQALFESKNEGAVEVDGPRARFVGLGEAPVLARYGGLAATVTIGATPLPPLAATPDYPEESVVDREIFGKLRRLRVTPSPTAADAEFLRRVYLDLIGRIPTAAESERFLNSAEPAKRTALIDALLNGPEFPRHWRDNLNALLMGRAAFPMNAAWSEWLETALREDRGWDRLTRELLLARPESTAGNAALQFLDSRFAQGDTGLDVVTRDVSRIFFGVDIQCARCHTHPDVAAWQQQAYWGIAAFFGRTYRLPVKNVSYLAEKATGEVEYFGQDKNQRPALPVLLTGQALSEPPTPAKPAAVTGAAANMPPPEDPALYAVAPEEAKEKTRVPVPRHSRRERFVEMAVNGNDPFFRRAVINWVWAALMGRGLVEPVDQMHLGNPPSHPALLEGLSEEFVRGGFSLRKLIRSVVSSRAYAQSSEWRPAPASVLRERPPAELYAVAAVRPLSVQQLANSVLAAAGYSGATSEAATNDSGAARAQFETQYAAQLLEVRKRLDSGTEAFQPNVAQALFLSNSQEFQKMLDGGGLAARLAKLPNGEAVRHAYLSILSRPPDPTEAAAFTQHLAARAERRPAALKQIVWALITSAEFRFVH